MTAPDGYEENWDELAVINTRPLEEVLRDEVTFSQSPWCPCHQHRLDTPCPIPGPFIAVVYLQNGTTYFGPFETLIQIRDWALENHITAGGTPLNSPDSDPKTWWRGM